MRTPLAWSSLALCFIVCVGCTRSVRPGTVPAGPVSEADADSQTGPDGVRQNAVPMIPTTDMDEEMTIDFFESDGEVSWPARQRTRWRRADVSSQPMDANTPLRCELRSAPPTAELQVDAWNAEGQKLPEHHQRAPGLYVTEVFLEKPVPVYLRVRAMRPEDAARFKLRCSWQQLADYEVSRRGGRRRYRPHPTPAPEDRYDRGTEGRILLSFKDNGHMVLRIDKGELAGVKVGTEGTILEGRSGRQPLAGGEFKVVKVLSERECIAESSIRGIGRNVRVVLFLK